MQLLKKHPAISEETFLERIDAKKDSFYRVAYSYTRHREDALDVVSESVCKAYTHLHHLKDPDSFYPWFYRILSNTALTFVKRHRRFASLEDWDESVTPMEQTAEILAMREELARLEQKYREVLILKFNQDLTFREIAELTGKNENTVKTIYYHALELLRERMNPHETTE
ncbi:RNA polymerase sigma factor [Butyricicoccus pullicaecorum]|uniref:RNA polymerase sigma factor n=1 Tax=Butyricicoccus pullicaecorum TaxID=501571 RepID=UPI00399096F6